jgi:hypothetical protein
VISTAQAKEFAVKLGNYTQNEDGNYVSEKIAQGSRGASTVYELVPASEGVVVELLKKNAGCEGMLLVEGSVLSRNLEIDHEYRRYDVETVKILVRKVTGCR